MAVLELGVKVVEEVAAGIASRRPLLAYLAPDEDSELVTMVEHLADENGETPNEMLARLAREQFREGAGHRV